VECPVCEAEFDSALCAWSAVECPECGTVWIGLDEDSRRVLVTPQ
jgi:predicted RNA-binding Zn-ribbon protein involved in translation (DUF1610 family)